MKPYYDHGGITIYHGDCRELLSLGFSVDCVLSDPPWGTNTDCNAQRFSRAKSPWWKCVDNSKVMAHQQIVGDDKEFDPHPWIELPSILWGAPNFCRKLPHSNGWLIWDKRDGAEDLAQKGWPLGEAELAWTNVIGATRVFRNLWVGLLRRSERGEFYHPTQKPIELMEWCLQFMPDGAVLDPYMGAGSTLIAAKNKGRRATGIEIHEPYCEIAAKRLSQEVFQFDAGGEKAQPQSKENL